MHVGRPTGEEVLTLREGGVGPDCLAFSRDGYTLAVAVGEGSQEPTYVMLWDIDSGKQLAELTLPSGSLTAECVAFSVDGKTLTVACDKYSGHFLAGSVQHSTEILFWKATSEELDFIEALQHDGPNTRSPSSVAWETLARPSCPRSSRT
jgi:WD40 repeat protein